MLVICALLLLSSIIVDANHLRSNDILPLNVVFEGADHVGYTFIQDPLHPHKEDSIALQVSFRMTAVAKKSFYLCETKLVNRYREDNHIMIDSVNYEVSRHRKEHFLLLTATDGAVMKLTETNQTRRCMPDLVPQHEFHIPPHDMVAPAPEHKFMGWSLAETVATTNIEYFNARTGASVSTGLLEISPTATAACPSCNYLSGWDGENYWFSNFNYAHPSATANFVNDQTGAHLTWPLNYYVESRVTKVSQNYLLISGYSYAESKRYVHLYKKTDGSLHRRLKVPQLDVPSSHFCMGAFLSPGESRVLMVCPWNYQRQLAPEQEAVVSVSILLEMSADSGAVLTMSTLPVGFDLNYLTTGDRYSANSILVRANTEVLHMYKYNV